MLLCQNPIMKNSSIYKIKAWLFVITFKSETFNIVVIDHNLSFLIR